MKNKKDIMHVKEVYNKRNELSFELHCSGKDPLTKKYKVFVKTFKVPLDLKGKKEIEQFRLQCQIEYKKEVDKKSKGLCFQQDEKVFFYDYAEKWVEDIIRYKKDAYNHYARSKSNLKVFKDKFGLYTLQEITLPVVQNFCDWLCERTYKKETIVVKKTIKEVMKVKHLSFKEVYLGSGIANATLCTALKVGSTVNKTTATTLCNFLNIKFEDYFDFTSEDVYYSKSANKSLKNMLHSILAQAVREGRIAINYCTKDFTKPVTGTEKVKEIYETREELKQFVSCVEAEPDIRKKTAFSISLNLGLRGAEIAGLSWDCVDFENKTIKICKNTIFINGFGIVTKSVKTTSSNRIINMPQNLCEILKEYKTWWDNQKEMLGDFWGDINKLFVNRYGKDMSNATINDWLKKFQAQKHLKRVTLHGLRHTNVTFQIDNGANVKTVSARAGHKDIKTTLNIYAHYTRESDRKACDLINDILYE
ncbi:MAG: site-specific integrase [Clostridia bacterium]|nr:site-specific integrase [Clostridia bacterium]